MSRKITRVRNARFAAATQKASSNLPTEMRVGRFSARAAETGETMNDRITDPVTARLGDSSDILANANGLLGGRKVG
jgi:hypothetical protein